MVSDSNRKKGLKMSTDLQNDYYTIGEAAWELTVSEGTIRNLVKRKVLFAIVVGNGRCVRILKKSVDEYKDKLIEEASLAY